MPVSTSIRPLLYTTVAEAVYKEIISRTGRYYYFLGKVLNWPNELVPPKALESSFYESDTRRNMVLIKEIRPGDVALVANRINWESNVVYDMYDDRYSDELIGIDLVSGGTSYSGNTYLSISGGGVGASANVIVQGGKVTQIIMVENGYNYNTAPNVSIVDPDNLGSGANVVAVINKPYSGANTIQDSKFYVINDELNIYKCLDNNGNAPSTVQPVDVIVEPFFTGDGYKWKFIGSVAPTLKNKFLTSTDIPVTSSLTNSFYSNGEIKNIIIARSGDNYTTASIIVDGDGYLAADPFYIVSTTIKNSGSGYTTANIVIDPPFAYSSEWASGNLISAGAKVRAGNNIYQALLTGNTGISAPVHTSGEQPNGATKFLYLGTVATGNAIVTSGNVTSIVLNGILKEINLTNGGYGYNYAPSVQISGGGGTGGEGYAVLRGNTVLKIIITDFGTDYLSSPTVTIGDAWQANNRTYIGEQVRNGNYLYTVVSANTNFRIGDARYDYRTANVSTQFTDTNGLYFNNTGTRLYVAGTGTSSNTVAQYNLSAAYDVSTANVNNISNINISTQDTNPQDITFSALGNVMFVVGGQNDKIYRYNLANAWNVVSATYVSNLSVSAFETEPTCMFINQEGNKLFMAGTATKKVQAYDLTVPWDIANANVGSNVTISGFEANVTGLSFNSTGKIMTLVGSSSDSFNQFYLSNAWDVTTATYFNTFPVDNFDSSPASLYYAEEDDKLYLLGGSTKKVYQFKLPKSVFFGTNAPVHISGNVYSGDAYLYYTGNAAAATAVLKYGSGYKRTPNITIYGDGANASAVVNVLKSEAKLTPVLDNGKIVNVIVEDGGVGYTNARLNVTGDGSNVLLYADLSEGDIQTLQGNNELLAVDGAIEAIKLVSGGYGYTSANVFIYGDGTGANAQAIVNDGRVTKIEVVTAGFGYTFANVVIEGNNGSAGASARAILPPEGGHGFDIVSELFTRSLAMYSSITDDTNKGFNVVNDYRQVGLIKDIRSYENDSFFTKVVGSGCFVISGDVSSGLIVDDATLLSLRGHRYQIIAKDSKSVLVSALDKVAPIIGDRMSINGTFLFTVTGVTPPDVDKYSGKLMYIDNREAFVSSDEQYVSIKTVFKY